MDNTGHVTFKYKASDNQYLCDTSVPGQIITVESPHTDLTINQYFKLFSSFLSAIGFNSISIMKGATELAFSEDNNEEDMKTVAEEYGLLMEEQLYEKNKEIEDEAFECKLKYEEAQKEIHKLQVEIIDLSAHLSRAQNPDNPNYTEKEMEAMEYWAKSKQSDETPKNDY
jgi:hypothetical protein